MNVSRSIVIVLAAIAAAATGGPSAWSGEIVIGLQCDRTGPTQIVGNILCPAYHDYVKLINAKGGIGLTMFGGSASVAIDSPATPRA